MTQVDAAALLAEATEQFRRGDHSAAERTCRALLEADPACPTARQLLGIIACRAGDLAAAEAQFLAVLERDAGSAAALTNLGLVRQRQNRLEPAAQCHLAALAINPDFPEAQANLALVRARQGRWAEAASLGETALARRPGMAEAATHLGLALHRLGRFEAAVARQRDALRLRPDYAAAHNNLGLSLRALGRAGEAMDSFRRAIECDPAAIDPLFNLACLLDDGGRLAEARDAYRRVLDLAPDHGEALGQLVHLRRRLCDWAGLAADETRLIDLVRQGARVPPFALLASPLSAAEQRAGAEAWAAAVAVPAATIRRTEPGERLRVGYLSTDFRQHAVATLMIGPLERHDRTRFDITLFALGAGDDGPMRHRLMEACDAFIDLNGLDHGAAAERINRHGIDILIDLNGWTRGARPEILAARPAPLQVSYLGFPGGSGAGFIDYLIADSVVIPAGEERHYREAVVRLGGCYQPNDPRRTLAAAPSRADCGLPEDGVVFCCFNAAFKISPELFRVWMELLAARPGAVLWLLDDTPTATATLRAEAARHGIAAERLVFAPRVPQARHLARHALADLVLDTMPYNAHTTASDALWAGVPLLTCRGATFAGRVAASLLLALDLPELATASLEEYRALALKLAGDRDMLAALRARLAHRRDSAPPFDAAAIARRLEAAYGRMWQSHRAGETPRPFFIP